MDNIVSEQYKRYREEGIMSGVFLWLDALGRSIDTLTSIAFQRNVEEIAPENDMKRFVLLPDSHVTLTFADGTSALKSFTPEQFRGERP